MQCVGCNPPVPQCSYAYRTTPPFERSHIISERVPALNLVRTGGNCVHMDMALPETPQNNSRCVDVQGMLRPAPLEVYESPVSVLNNPGAYSPQSILLPQHVVLRGHSRATQDPRIGQPPKRWRCLNHVGSIHTPVRNKSTPTHCSHRLNQRNISSISHFNTSSGA